MRALVDMVQKHLDSSAKIELKLNENITEQTLSTLV